MRIILLLLISITCSAQNDTILKFNYFTRSTAVYNFQGKLIQWKGDTVDLKGAFLNIRKTREAIYMGAPIRDTLLILNEDESIIDDSTHFRTISFKGGALGLFIFGKVELNGSITDNLYIDYPDTVIPENVPKQYWDYKSVWLIISIVRKTPSYSD